MNRFVMILPVEDDDGYVEIPHPIETELTLEELIQSMQDFYESMPPRKKDGCRATSRNRNKNLSLSNNGTCIAVHQLENYMWRSGSPGKPTFWFEPPIILTADEWFTGTV